VSTSPFAGRSWSAHRQFLAIVTAAFILLQPVVFPSAAAVGQVMRTPLKTTSPGRIDPLISITTLGSPITQNFDTLATSGTTNAWADDTTLAGWYSQFSAQPTNPTVYRADSGGSNAGAIYSWGVEGTNPLTERAFGSIGSGTPGDIYNAIKLTNNSGSTITSLDVSYVGEQWRQGGCTPTPCTPAAQTVDLQYQVANAGTITDANTPATGWLDHNPLDFTSPQPGTSTAAAIDGNAAANRTALSSTITVTVNNGQDVWLRWRDINHANNDHGLAVDDFSITPQGSGGGTPTLSINDVMQAEGNAGTTTFTFTVNLSQPAGAGGVTFDIATADGTAQDDNPVAEDNDYVAQSLSGQTIPADSSSYTFNVTVNGDTTPEPNETFFVNVTNVTGATLNDGQGLGTIVNDDVTITPIYSIQGSGTSSPFVSMSVTTTGIVTGRKTNGYFLQDPTGDGNLNTSDGIFVFTNIAPTGVAVGDSVQVSGTVVEFESSTTDEPDGVSPPDPKTLTEISSPTTVILSTGNPLPAALSATSLNIFDPAAPSRGAELEKYECMRLSVDSITVSEPTNNFGEFWGVEPPRARPFREPGIEKGDPVPAADEGPFAGSPPPNAPIFDGNFERVMVDSDDAIISFGPTVRRAQVQVTAGTAVTGVVGPLDYAFDNYRIVLDATATPGVAGGIAAAVPVPSPAATEFTIAHANLENFGASNANFAGRLNKASLAIRNVLGTPDILGVIEVFDLASLQQLATKINTDAGNPSVVNYQAYLEEGVAGGGDDQDIGYLVNAARVTVVGAPVQYHQGTTFVFNGVTDTLHDRPSYILTADIPQIPSGTLRVTTILNHTKSLIAVDSPRPFNGGPPTEGARNREKRRLQAEDIADEIQRRQTENLVVLGDLNAFDFNDGLTDVVGTFKGTPVPANQVVEPSTDRWTYQLTNLLGNLTPDQRYSFCFEGNAQVLDHVLVNNQMLARNNRFAYGRYNADFSESFAADTTRPERLSDHDAPVAYFAQGPPQPSGSFIISEYRLRGSGAGGENPIRVKKFDVRRERGVLGSSTTQDNDEFIEFYNNTDSAIRVETVDGSAGWSLVASDGITRFTIPNGTVIPARGHYLATNEIGYSLASYPGGNDGANETSSNGDILYDQDIPDGSGIALFNTANPENFNEAHRLDAVGYSANPPLYREGSGFNSDDPGEEFGGQFGNFEFSFVRDLRSGTHKDTNDNVADFLGIATSAQRTTNGTNLGAPGPENLFSPIRRLSMLVNFLDPSVPNGSSPNRVKDTTPVQNGDLGTLSIRRTVTNNTGEAVTRLRFRIKEITTLTSPTVTGQADIRALSSSDIDVTVNDKKVFVQGTTLEIPPFQPLGGGWNTSWTPTGTINLESPLLAGESINVQFLVGIMRGGTFRIFINVEALP
jgi:predicted extracellular nuclease